MVNRAQKEVFIELSKNYLKLKIILDHQNNYVCSNWLLKC